MNWETRIDVCVCVCGCGCVHTSTQWNMTLGNSMDYSPPGSSIHGIFLAKILQWVAISSFSGSSRTRLSNPLSPALQADSLSLSH